MHFLNNANVEITLLNVRKVETRNSNFISVKGDASDLSEYKDKEFDIVYSNSVIEHLFTKENQKKMADEVRRVGKNYYVQTPNYYFPIEPHWLFPLYHFFPFGFRVFLTRHISTGHFQERTSIKKAIIRVSEGKTAD